MASGVSKNGTRGVSAPGGLAVQLRQQFENRFDRAFRSLDTNADGRVSRAEWRGDLMQFDRLDVNHDGFLSWDEFTRQRG